MGWEPGTRDVRDGGIGEPERRGPKPFRLADDMTTLALAARAGDVRAREGLWAAAGPRLLRLALLLGVRPEDAPDLVQECLLAADGALVRFDAERASIGTWLSTILVRRVRNHRRGAARRQRFLGVLAWRVRTAPHRSSPQEQVDARLTLASLVAGLTPQQREVVALYETAGLTAAETGRALGISAGAVRTIAWEARRRLGRLVQEQEEEA